MTPADFEAHVARCFRADAGRAVATLTQVIGDLELAEEAIADAYLIAMERWPHDGFPTNASAWILTTARRRAIDRLRQKRVGREKAERIAAWAAIPVADPAEDDVLTAVDDRLGLMFACTHPALASSPGSPGHYSRWARLTTREIADAFLIPVETMAQRLVGVKRKIRAAAIPSRVSLEHSDCGNTVKQFAPLYRPGRVKTTQRLFTFDFGSECRSLPDDIVSWKEADAVEHARVDIWPGREPGHNEHEEKRRTVITRQ